MNEFRHTVTRLSRSLAFCFSGAFAVFRVPIIVVFAVRQKFTREVVSFDQLKANTNQFRDFMTAHNVTFGEVLTEIEKAVSEYNVFLYLDPFTVTGLAWNALDRIFQQVNHRQSVECLINFNVCALARAACVSR